MVVRGCRRSVIVGRRCRLPRLPLAVVMVVVVSVVVSGWCCGWGCGWDCRWDCRRRRRTHRRLSEAVGGCRRRLAVGWPSMGCGWPSVFVGSRRFPSLSVPVVVGSRPVAVGCRRRRLPPLSIAVVVVGRRLSSVCVDFCRLVFAVEVEAAAPVEAAVAVEVTAVVEIAAVAVGCRGCRRRPSVAIAAFVSIKM